MCEQVTPLAVLRNLILRLALQGAQWPENQVKGGNDPL